MTKTQEINKKTTKLIDDIRTNIKQTQKEIKERRKKLAENELSD